MCTQAAVSDNCNRQSIEDVVKPNALQRVQMNCVQLLASYFDCPWIPDDGAIAPALRRHPIPLVPLHQPAAFLRVAVDRLTPSPRRTLIQNQSGPLCQTRSHSKHALSAALCSGPHTASPPARSHQARSAVSATCPAND